MKCPFLLALSAIALLASVHSHAQTQDVNFTVRCIADPAKVTKALDDAAKQNAEPRITGTAMCFPGQEQPSAPGEYTFGSELILVVEHAPETDFDELSEPDPQDLVLFLDGKSIPGTHPRVGPSAFDPDAVTTTLLTYRITHDVSTPAAQKNWAAVLTGPKRLKLMTVSTGLDGGAAAPSQATILFTAVPSGRAFAFALIAIFVLILFFLVAGKTGALRDKEPAEDPHLPGKRRAYSLSRCQAAAWTVLTVLAFLFVWILTGQYNAMVPASVVTLMGISIVTYGVAAGIDAAAVRTKQEKIQTLAATRGADHAEKIAALTRQSQVCLSEGLATDLVTSSEGASLHRLQFVVWTLALMVVFAATVWRNLQMPDFDSTLLALMGISSGGYAALKVPENKS